MCTCVACLPQQETVSPEARSAVRRVHPTLSTMSGIRVHGERLPVRLPASQEGLFVAGHYADNVSGCQRGDELPGELKLPPQGSGTELTTAKVECN